MATANFFPELNPRISAESVGDQQAWPESTQMDGIRQWCEAAWEEAESDQKGVDELKFVDKYVEYITGTQWPTARPSYKSKPVDNLTNRLFWELHSLLTDIRPIIEISSTSREEKDIAQEDKLNKRIHAWWLNNDIDQKTAMCIVYGILTSSFAKLEWDPEAKPMGRGELALRPLSPLSVLPLKGGTDLQSAEACIYHDWKPTSWVKNKYSDRAHLVIPDAGMSQYSVDTGPPGNVTPQLFDLLASPMKQLLSKDKRRLGASAFPMCKYREFWIKDRTINTSNRIVTMGDATKSYRISYQVKPGQMFYPRGRLIVMAGREIVYDNPNPYWHGLFPFALLRLNVVPWSMYGLSDMRSLCDMQDILNAMFAGVIDMVKKAVNPPFFAPKNAFAEGVWNSFDPNMPSSKLAYNAVSPQEPKWVNSAPLPGYVLPVMEGVKRDMKEGSGIAAVNDALRKKQVPGGDTLDQIRQTQQTPIRAKARNIEIFLRDLGVQMVPNIAQFYTDPERVRVNASMGGSAEYLDWNPKEVFGETAQPMEQIRKYEFTIQEGSLLSVQRLEMATNLAKLRMNGAISNRTFLTKLNKLGLLDVNVDQEEQLIMKERAAGLGGAPPKKGKKGEAATKVQ
jgi:hypothetical protein